MLMIYCPQSMAEASERRLEQALERDGARVHYVGNDGAEEYVIVEAADFAHTRQVAGEMNLSLSWHEQLPAPVPESPEPGPVHKTRRKRKPA